MSQEVEAFLPLLTLCDLFLGSNIFICFSQFEGNFDVISTFPVKLIAANENCLVSSVNATAAQIIFLERTCC